MEMTKVDSPGDQQQFDFDDQGFSMGNDGDGITPRRRRGNRKNLWFAVIVLVALAGLAYAVVPKFGLPKWASSGGDDDGAREFVSEDSLIDNDAYDIILQLPVKTVAGDVVVYRHRKTGTPVMTILPWDTEQDSVFGIAFRTKPQNSHGAPHVLEHSLLTGSKKFPIKVCVVVVIVSIVLEYFTCTHSRWIMCLTQRTSPLTHCKL